MLSPSEDEYAFASERTVPLRRAKTERYPRGRPSVSYRYREEIVDDLDDLAEEIRRTGLGDYFNPPSPQKRSEEWRDFHRPGRDSYERPSSRSQREAVLQEPYFADRVRRPYAFRPESPPPNHSGYRFEDVRQRGSPSDGPRQYRPSPDTSHEPRQTSSRSPPPSGSRYSYQESIDRGFRSDRPQEARFHPSTTHEPRPRSPRDRQPPREWDHARSPRRPPCEFYDKGEQTEPRIHQPRERKFYEETGRTEPRTHRSHERDFYEETGRTEPRTHRPHRSSPGEQSRARHKQPRDDHRREQQDRSRGDEDLPRRANTTYRNGAYADSRSQQDYERMFNSDASRDSSRETPQWKKSRFERSRFGSKFFGSTRDGRSHRQPEREPSPPPTRSFRGPSHEQPREFQGRREQAQRQREPSPPRSSQHPSFDQRWPSAGPPEVIGPSFVETKALFDTYNKAWAGLSRTDPELPFPDHISGIDFTRHHFFNIPLTDTTQWTRDEIHASNYQSFFALAHSLSFAYTREEKGGLQPILPPRIIRAPGTRQSLQALIKYLRRKEIPRWHPDKLNARTGVEGKLDQRIGIRADVCRVRNAAQVLLAIAEKTLFEIENPGQAGKRFDRSEKEKAEERHASDEEETAGEEEK